MGQIRLDQTSQAEVLALLPEFKPGTESNSFICREPDIRCHGSSGYGLRMQNWPGGIIASLQEKLDYRFPWLFEAIYLLGHRYLGFVAFVEIRGGTVSRCEYALEVQNGEFPANEFVIVEVFGGDFADFLSHFGSARGDEETSGFRGRVPSNKPTTVLSLAYTAHAKAEDVRNAFDVHLDCLWNTRGCSTTKQLLPALWKQRMEPGGQK